MNPIKPISRLLVATGCMAFAGGALATPCSSAVSQYEFYVSIGDAVNAQFVLSNHPECFGGGSTTSQVQINSTTGQQFVAITNILSSRFSGSSSGPVAFSGARGAAAGAGGGKWNLWGSVANTDTKQSYNNVANFTTNNDNDVINTVIGGDIALTANSVIGVSVALDRGDGSGSTTQVGSGVNVTTSKGFTVAPYYGMQINKDWSFDASAGYGQGDMTMAGTNTVALDRWFAGANLNFNRWSGNLQYTARVGLLHAVEDYEDIKVNGATQNGTKAKNTLDQLQAGAQLGYWMNGVMPYAGLKYSSDVNRDTTQFGATNDPIGKGAWVWTVGVNFFSTANGITGGVAYSQEEGRTNQKNGNLTANLNVRF